MLRWIYSLSGGKFEGGIAEELVTTVLGNLALTEFSDGLSENALLKEKAQYFTLARIQNTVKHSLLPQMTVHCKDNKKTKNGDWCLTSESQKLKVWASLQHWKT